MNREREGGSMRLSKLIAALQGVEIMEEKDWEREIIALSVDSRKTQESGLFVCLVGENVDGHNLVKEAQRNGAVAILAQRRVETSLPLFLVPDTRKALSILASVFYGEPSKRMRVIGITGTNGKTTTSYMLASILQAAGRRVGVIGTLGAVYMGKRCSTELTTPDPIELNRLLAEMVSQGAEYVVMEVSAHALHYQKTEGVSFAACIFTNFTQDHLDFFQDMKAYKEAKMKLFSPAVCPIAIVNGDEEVGREIAAMREEVNTCVYALNTPADCFAVVTDESLKSTECMLNLNDKLYRVHLHLLGEYNVYNALAAASCAEGLGFSDYIAEGLSSVEGVRGRLQWVGELHGAAIYVDFAHTPDGLAKSLETLRKHCNGRLICLFGCGGNRDKGKRPIMGEMAAKKCDFCVLTSDNPRYEDPLDIIANIEVGYRRFSTSYVIVPNRERAIDYALDCLQTGDILLIAGKGGEEYQEIMGIKHPFNDQDMVEKFLKQKRKNF